MRFAVLALLLLAALPARAGYSIAVGAYRDAAAASRLAATASGILAQPFRVEPAAPGADAVRRVVAGPFATRAEARRQAAAAHRAGFVGAWVLPARMPEDAVPTAAAPLDAEIEALLDDAWTTGAPSLETLLDELPDIPARQPARAQAQPAVPTAIPGGYRLHKLDRGPPSAR